MFINVDRGVFVRTRRLLLIATRRIRLRTLRTTLLRPFRFFLTNGQVTRTLLNVLQYVIPMAIKIMPRGRVRILLIDMLRRLFRTIASSILFPTSIGRHVFVARFANRIGRAGLIVMISAQILPRGPTPDEATRLMFLQELVRQFRRVGQGNDLRGQLRPTTRHGHAPKDSAQRDRSQDEEARAIRLTQVQGDGAMGAIFDDVARVKDAVRATCANLKCRHPIITRVGRYQRDVTFAMLKEDDRQFVKCVFLFMTQFNARPTGRQIALQEGRHNDNEEGIGTNYFLFGRRANHFTVLERLMTRDGIIITRLRRSIRFLLIDVFGNCDRLINEVVCHEALSAILHMHLFRLVHLLTSGTRLATRITSVECGTRKEILRRNLSIMYRQVSELTVLRLGIRFRAEVEANGHYLLNGYLENWWHRYTGGCLFFREYFSGWLLVGTGVRVEYRVGGGVFTGGLSRVVRCQRGGSTTRRRGAPYNVPTDVAFED